MRSLGNSRGNSCTGSPAAVSSRIIRVADMGMPRRLSGDGSATIQTGTILSQLRVSPQATRTRSRTAASSCSTSRPCQAARGSSAGRRSRSARSIASTTCPGCASRTRWTPAATEVQAADAVPRYFAAYESAFELPVYRPVTVKVVCDRGDRFVIETDRLEVSARGIINATGTWETPYIPEYPGAARFRGRQLHTKDYRTADGLPRHARPRRRGGDLRHSAARRDLARHDHDVGDEADTRSSARARSTKRRGARRLRSSRTA